MTRTLAPLLSLALTLATGCDGGSADSDAGSRDAGTERRDAGGGHVDAGGGDADAGGGEVDAGSGDCPCFGPAEITAIEEHATAGGTRGCMTGVVSGTVVSGALSSTLDAENLQVSVQEISGVARTDWTCGSGCSDLDDDLVDDCAGAALPAYESMVVSEAQHDACEALIVTACE